MKRSLPFRPPAFQPNSILNNHNNPNSNSNDQSSSTLKSTEIKIKIPLPSTTTNISQNSYNNTTDNIYNNNDNNFLNNLIDFNEQTDYRNSSSFKSEHFPVPAQFVEIPLEEMCPRCKRYILIQKIVRTGQYKGRKYECCSNTDRSCRFFRWQRKKSINKPDNNNNNNNNNDDDNNVQTSSNNVSTPSSSSSPFADQRLPDKCPSCKQHNLLKRVARSGPNKGRDYAVCSGVACRHFQWLATLSDVVPHLPLRSIPLCYCKEPKPCVLMQARKKTKNFNRYFYECSNWSKGKRRVLRFFAQRSKSFFIYNIFTFIFRWLYFFRMVRLFRR
jgi:hypothetical protein